MSVTCFYLSLAFVMSSAKIDRERDRAAILPSTYFATCMRLAHPRARLTAKPAEMRGVVCDVCRRVIPDGEERSRCSFCDNDICAGCLASDAAAIAVTLVPAEWVTRRQLLRDDPATRSSIPRRTALLAKAREILERHRAEIECRARWQGEFVAAEFVVDDDELGDFSAVTMVHAFSQLGKEVHGMTFTRVDSAVDRAGTIVSVAYPFEAVRPVTTEYYSPALER